MENYKSMEGGEELTIKNIGSKSVSPFKLFKLYIPSRIRFSQYSQKGLPCDKV